MILGIIITKTAHREYYWRCYDLSLMFYSVSLMLHISVTSLPSPSSCFLLWALPLPLKWKQHVVGSTEVATSPWRSSGGCTMHASYFVCVCEPHHLATSSRLSRSPADSQDQLADWTTVPFYKSRPEADRGRLLLRVTRKTLLWL